MDTQPSTTANVPRPLVQRLVVAVRDQATGRRIQQAAREHGFRCDDPDVVSLAAAAGRVVQIGPHLVLVVCDGRDAAGLEAIQAVHQVTGAPIHACGDDTDALLICNAIRHGASAFLSLERIDRELAGCAAVRHAAVRPFASGRGIVAGFIAASGGVGLSTTAANLAVELAADHENSVVLVEMRPAPGDLAILLDIESGHSLNELLRRADQLDTRMLRAACAPHRQGIHVLAQVPCDGGAGVREHHWGSAPAMRVLELLRETYSHVVLDMDHELDEVRTRILAACDFCGLVIRPDVPGVRRAGWLLGMAGRGGLRRGRFSAILARSCEGHCLPPYQVAEVLGIPVIQSIPEDVKSIQRAVNEGITFAEVSRNSRIRRSISSLAHCVCTNARSIAT